MAKAEAYSHWSAMTGSTCDAPHAGIIPATSPTKSKTAAALTRIAGYCELTPYKKSPRNRVEASAATSPIPRTNGARSPWERRTAGGELVRSYWPKDHCLDLERLQLEANLWGLIDKCPERYSLVLSSPSGEPIEVLGIGLRAMLEQLQMKICPAAFDSLSVFKHER